MLMTLSTSAFVSNRLSETMQEIRTSNVIYANLLNGELEKHTCLASKTGTYSKAHSCAFHLDIFENLFYKSCVVDIANTSEGIRPMLYQKIVSFGQR